MGKAKKWCSNRLFFAGILSPDTAGLFYMYDLQLFILEICAPFNGVYQDLIHRRRAQRFSQA